jgi:hypothetical protein
MVVGCGNARAMKVRLLAMGGIISALGAILIVVRGYSASLVGLLAVRIVLLVAGVIYK